MGIEFIVSLSSLLFPLIATTHSTSQKRHTSVVAFITLTIIAAYTSHPFWASNHNRFAKSRLV